MQRTIKKGFGTVTTAFFSYVVFTLLVIIFFFIIALQTDTIAEQKEATIGSNGLSSTVLGSGLDLHWDLTLMNYLRTPVTVEGDSLTMGDLIILWYHNPEKYEPLLTSTSTELLSQWTDHYMGPSLLDQTKKRERVMAYGIRIAEEPKVRGKLPQVILTLYADQFKHGHCLYTCDVLRGAYLPVSETKTIYIGLIASDVPASSYEDE